MCLTSDHWSTPPVEPAAYKPSSSSSSLCYVQGKFKTSFAPSKASGQSSGKWASISTASSVESNKRSRIDSKWESDGEEGMEGRRTGLMGGGGVKRGMRCWDLKTLLGACIPIALRRFLYPMRAYTDQTEAVLMHHGGGTLRIPAMTVAQPARRRG